MEMQRPPRRRMRKVLVLFFGWMLIVMGLIGGLLPIIQGWIFGVAGLLLLSTEYEWARRIIHKAKSKFPRFARAMDRVQADSERLLRRLFGRQSR